MSHGLNLGPLPFSPGRQRYTPPERRRRRAGPATSRPARRKPRAGAATGWESAGHVPFLGVQRGRIRGALGASFTSHLLAVALVLLVVRTTPVEEIFEERINYDIVWIPQAGPGGGGGGGGNESLEMPRQVEAAGEDTIDVPVEVPEEVEAPPEVEPEPEPEPLESQNIQLSAVPMGASLQARTGLLDGLLSGALDSAGSGSGGGAGEGSGGGIGPGEGGRSRTRRGRWHRGRRLSARQRRRDSPPAARGHPEVHRRGDAGQGAGDRPRRGGGPA